jgi:hypothetical protein
MIRECHWAHFPAVIHLSEKAALSDSGKLSQEELCSKVPDGRSSPFERDSRREHRQASIDNRVRNHMRRPEDLATSSTANRLRAPPDVR